MGAESSTMQNAASTCKGCKNLGNKQVDTVKLDMEKFRDASGSAAAEKENNDPGQMRRSPAQKNQREQEQRLKEAEEREAMHRAEVEREEARRRAVEQAEERVRQLELEKLRNQQEEEEEEEEQERRRIAAQKEEARRVELAQIAEQKRHQVEEEERLRRILQEKEERLLKQKEEEEREEVLRRRAEEEERARRNQLLQAFLEKAGFDAVGEKKVKKGIISSGFFYPLHAAVEQKDAEAVELLLWAGADPCLANSKKLTPLKLALAKNKQGSHDKVIAALAA